MTIVTKKNAAEAGASAPPADGNPSQIAYLTGVLKTPTIGATWEDLAAQARDGKLVPRGIPRRAAAASGR